MSDIDISRDMVEHLCHVHRGYKQHGTVAMLLALRAALDRAEADKAAAVAALVKALQYYADPQNWRDTPSWDGDPEYYTAKAIPVHHWNNNACDCGSVARAALAPFTEAKP